jgi:hypothetical protein
MKLASGVMLIAFGMSMVVQLNDPDPIRWVVLYGIAAALSGLALAGRLYFWPTAVACLVYLGGIALLWDAAPDTTPAAFVSIAMKDVVQERVRELWGLVLCLSWCSVLLWRSRAPAVQAEMKGQSRC